MNEFYVRIFEVHKVAPQLAAAGQMLPMLLDHRRPGALDKFNAEVAQRHAYWVLSSIEPPFMVHIYYDGPMPDDGQRDVWNGVVWQQAVRALENR